MQFEWSTSQKEIREKFRQFGETEVAPEASLRDQQGTFDHELWKRLSVQDFWKLHIPREYGGYGGSPWDFIAALEGLSAGATDFGFLMSVIAHAGLIQVLLDYGTPEQLKQHFPVLLNGGVGATAATEPTGGSHVAAVRTAAQRLGNMYSLNGQKAHITNAPICDLVLIVGRIPELGSRDITLFLLNKHHTGLSFGGHEDLMGQRSSPTGSIYMENVSVTEADVIGLPGNGLETLYTFLAFDRLMYGIEVAGYLERIINLSLERATNRHAFGVPLTEHEYIQDKLVDMKLTMESSRWLSYSALDALIRKDPSFASQASLAKLTASEGMVRAGLEIIQIFGHSGYDRTNSIERILRDAVALRIAGGTTEMQKKKIFKSLVHSCHKTKVNLRTI